MTGLWRVALTHPVMGTIHTEACSLEEAAEIRLRLEADLPTWAVELEAVST